MINNARGQVSQDMLALGPRPPRRICQSLKGGWGPSEHFVGTSEALRGRRLLGRTRPVARRRVNSRFPCRDWHVLNAPSAGPTWPGYCSKLDPDGVWVSKYRVRIDSQASRRTTLAPRRALIPLLALAQASRGGSKSKREHALGNQQGPHDHRCVGYYSSKARPLDMHTYEYSKSRIGFSGG